MQNRKMDVKWPKHTTTSESECGTDSGEVEVQAGKKKGTKNAKPTEFIEEKHPWTTDEIECIMNIMEEMLEQCNTMTKKCGKR